MNEFLAQLSVALIPVIATGLTALIGLGITYLSALVKARFGEAAKVTADRYLSMLQDAATQAVVSVQQSTVDVLKREGKWDQAAAEAVKRQALDIALASLGSLRAQAEARLQIDLPTYMGGLIEVALRNLKQFNSLSFPSQQG